MSARCHHGGLAKLSSYQGPSYVGTSPALCDSVDGFAPAMSSAYGLRPQGLCFVASSRTFSRGGRVNRERPDLQTKVRRSRHDSSLPGGQNGQVSQSGQEKGPSAVSAHGTERAWHHEH